jgi:hypothetical protein
VSRFGVEKMRACCGEAQPPERGALAAAARKKKKP